jgi:hypothetical protein
MPPGPVSAETVAMLRLTNGITTHFKMKRFNPQKNWMWSGKLLCLDIEYDHRIELVCDEETRMIFTVAAQGIGLSTIGRLFAAQYSKNLDVAIPKLQAEYIAASNLDTPLSNKPIAR